MKPGKYYGAGWILLLLLAASCPGRNRKSSGSTTRLDTPRVTAPATSVKDTSSEKVYFKATGNEPFWRIEISDESLRFTSLTTGFETFNAPHTEPAQAADANVKRYRSATEKGQMQVQIKQEKCTDSMSGMDQEYTVTVELKRGVDKDFTVFKGCGSYVTDYRLHDIWVLEELAGKRVSKAQFEKELPFMEIKAQEASFTGFAGCNRMNGKLFSERDRLRFTQVSTTRKLCPPQNQEAQFLAALQSSTKFKIENNRLYLFNAQGTKLVFRKTD